MQTYVERKEQLAQIIEDKTSGIKTKGHPQDLGIQGAAVLFRGFGHRPWSRESKPLIEQIKISIENCRIQDIRDKNKDHSQDLGRCFIQSRWSPPWSRERKPLTEQIKISIENYRTQDIRDKNKDHSEVLGSCFIQSRWSPPWSRESTPRIGQINKSKKASLFLLKHINSRAFI